MRMRLVGGVVAIVALAAVALVVIGGGGGGPAKLPIVVTGAGGGEGDGASREASASTAADMMMRANIVYRAGDDLPELGGDGRAYRIDSSAVDVDDVRELAEAFGLEGGVTTEGSTWQLIDGDSQISVFREGAVSWSYAATGAQAITRDAGDASDCDGPDCSVSSSPSSDEIKAREAEAIDSTATTEPQRPADLPSQDDAEDIALELFEKIDGDREGARVQSFDGITNWGVTIDPAIDGMPVIGLSTYVTVGSAGTIEWANGWLGTPEAADEYPLVTTTKAIDQLNDPAGYFGDLAATSGVAADDAGAAEAREKTLEEQQAGGGEPATTTVDAGEVCIAIFPPPPGCGGGSDGSDSSTGSGSAGGAAGSGATTPPDAADRDLPNGDPGSVDPAPPVDSIPPSDTEPMEEPEPMVVTLTGAEQGLMLTFGADGREAWLVPAYLFESDQGTEAGPVVGLAISPEHITAPASQTDEPVAKPEPMPMPLPEPDGREPATTIPEG